MAYANPPRFQFPGGKSNHREENAPTWHSEPQSRRSSQSTGSEYSPITSSFSSNSHTRMSSSMSSYSSSPPASDPLEQQPSVLKKSAPALADVVEDPMEKDIDRSAYTNQHSYSLDLQNSWSTGSPCVRSSLEAPVSNRYNYGNDIFSHTVIPSEYQAKRRRSGESAFNRLTSRVFQRLPTLSAKNGRNLRVTTTQSAPCSEVTSPVAGRSRSNSRARPLFSRSGSDSAEKGAEPSKLSTSIDTIDEDDDIDSDEAEAGPRDEEVESPLGITRTSTPLLPLMMEYAMPDERMERSNLPPPNVAPSSAMASIVPSPHGTPQMSSYHSPALSTKDSASQSQYSPKDAISHSWEMPPMFISQPDDEWSDKLGHADFQIEPQPYRPKEYSQESCRVLLGEWEKARIDYSKHLTRTSTYYGTTSKTYRLTELKWASIDATWKKNYNWAQAKARANGDVAPPDSPTEPTPVVKIPSMDDKFPQISEAGIVGAMVQGPAQQPPTPRKNSLFRIFDGLRGRASTIL